MQEELPKAKTRMENFDAEEASKQITGAAKVISDSFFQDKAILLFLFSLDLHCMKNTTEPIFWTTIWVILGPKKTMMSAID